METNDNVVSLVLLIVFFLVLGTISYFFAEDGDFHHSKKKKVKKTEILPSLGDLTGKYKHEKTCDGVLIKVEYKVKKSNTVEYRIATEDDLKLLQKHKKIK